MKTQALEKAAEIRPPQRRSLTDLLAPLDRLAESSQYLVSKSVRHFDCAGESYGVPRYVYLGPRGGGDRIRIGIFAAIHGDEPEGALATVRLGSLLERNPEIATDYALYIYPVCNPTGFEDNTRHSRNGRDLNREFWRQSAEPEVRFLESEIYLHAFDGIVTLHSDDTCEGLYGFVSGDVLSENLLEPALREGERILSRDERPVIDGFAARRGIITEGYRGVLASLPGVARPPFEITFETPQKAPQEKQVEAGVVVLQAILVEYRSLMAIGQNI